MRDGTEKFSGCVEKSSVDALATLSGSELQMEEAAAGKARLPTVHSLTDSTVRRLVAAERSVLRPGCRSFPNSTVKNMKIGPFCRSYR